MIVSRCLGLGRLSSNTVKNLLLCDGKTSTRQQIKRHYQEKYYYRNSPREEEVPNKLLYEILGGTVWWWVLWHLFTDYHKLLPFNLPVPEKWTDKELGIPPLDE